MDLNQREVHFCVYVFFSASEKPKSHCDFDLDLK